MISPRLADELLVERGIEVDLGLRGVSLSIAKQCALAQAGVSLYPDIIAALWDLEG